MNINVNSKSFRADFNRQIQNINCGANCLIQKNLSSINDKFTKSAKCQPFEKQSVSFTGGKLTGLTEGIIKLGKEVIGNKPVAEEFTGLAKKESKVLSKPFITGSIPDAGIDPTKVADWHVFNVAKYGGEEAYKAFQVSLKEKYLAQGFLADVADHLVATADKVGIDNMAEIEAKARAGITFSSASDVANAAIAHHDTIKTTIKEVLGHHRSIKDTLNTFLDHHQHVKDLAKTVFEHRHFVKDGLSALKHFFS